MELHPQHVIPTDDGRHQPTMLGAADEMMLLVWFHGIGMNKVKILIIKTHHDGMVLENGKAIPAHMGHTQVLILWRQQVGMARHPA